MSNQADKGLSFGELRKYISKVDPISLCFYESMNYENYLMIQDVSNDYDQYRIYGIGIIKSEFYKDDKGHFTKEYNKENLFFLDCIEIVLIES